MKHHDSSKLYTTQTPPVKTWVIHPYLRERRLTELEVQEETDEIINLTKALDLEVTGSHQLGLRDWEPKYLLTQASVKAIAEHPNFESAELVIINNDLTASQQRNCENFWKKKVLDRKGLIIEVFGKRAQSKEGKLQVELAALHYQKSRLVKLWTHLERQRSTGNIGGPGEKQLEMDRRILENKILSLKKELKKVERRKFAQRENRQRQRIPTIAFVGYTNAGKSTLFQAFSGEKTFIKDMLFATLDPLVRQVRLPSGVEVLFIDTVGFISDLPHELVDAFKTTLQESLSATLIVHVQDLSSPNFERHEQAVKKVLLDLMTEESLTDRLITLYNKSDTLKEGESNFWTERCGLWNSPSALVSALDHTTLAPFLTLVEKKLQSLTQEIHLSFSCDMQQHAALISHLQNLGRSLDMQQLDAEQALFQVELTVSEQDWKRIPKQLKEGVQNIHIHPVIF